MTTDYKRRFFHLRNTVAIDVFLEKRKTKEFVGRLTRNKNASQYFFTYDEKYFRQRQALSLGPELRLTQRQYTSPTLFIPFLDRIPSKENPAYVEYCAKFGVPADEKDFFVLLASIGSRGPSCFVFDPVFESTFSGEDSKQFRKSLGLTLREFSAAFDISLATVAKIENGASTGRDILKRIELYVCFPLVALYEVEKNASLLHEKVKLRLLQHLDITLSKKEPT